MPTEPDPSPLGGAAQVRSLPLSASERLILLVGLPLLGAVSWILVSTLFVSGNGTNAALPVVDFSVFWSAGRLANDGLGAQAYDWAAFAAALSADMGRDVPVGGLAWLNPPVFYLFVAPVSMLPFRWAWATWIAMSVLLVVVAVRVVLPRWSAVVAVLLAPGSVMTVALGQNALMTASLLSLSLVWIDRRPLLAGLCLGLIAYKPQFGLVLPILFALTGRWRVFLSATATVATLCLASAAWFGAEAWWAFLRSIAASRSRMDVSNEWIFEFQSVLLSARSFGLSPTVAWAAHIAVATTAVGLVAALWWRRRPMSDEAQAAAALATTFLLTPYVLPYDSVILAMACVFLVRASLRTGPRPWELAIGTGACIATALPLFMATHSAGWLAALAILGLALRRAGAPGFPNALNRI